MTLKWGIYVFDPEGDMGDGAIIGPITHGDAADREALAIRREAERVGQEIECIVVPMVGARDGKSYTFNRLRLSREHFPR